MRRDYKLHDIAGATIAFIVLLAFTLFAKGDPYNYGVGVACLAVFIIGAGKELVWDKWLHKGTPEWYDFFCTIRGGWMMIFGYKIIEKLIEAMI
jgi:hypothetical protein